MKFVVRKNAKGAFRWQAVGDNGEVMAVSENMTRKQSCLSAIETVKKQAADAEVVDKSDGAS
jgi:uncharacterized protein YegP (UPF0339 family)